MEIILNNIFLKNIDSYKFWFLLCYFVEALTYYITQYKIILNTYTWSLEYDSRQTTNISLYGTFLSIANSFAVHNFLDRVFWSKLWLKACVTLIKKKPACFINSIRNPHPHHPFTCFCETDIFLKSTYWKTKPIK